MTFPKKYPIKGSLEEKTRFLIPYLNAPKVDRLAKEIHFKQTHGACFDKLTNRQREVLTLIFNGKTSEEIAEELKITFNTVRTHRQDIRRGLGLRKCLQGVWYALAFDLME